MRILPACLTGLALVFNLSIRCAAADDSRPANSLEAEETYELRLERILAKKGHRGLLAYLTKEMAERPRPYVTAWYANYLLYGAEFGLKEVVDEERGFALAKQSAEAGARFGLELVGRAWGDGRGTGRRDPVQAVQFLREACQRDRNSAMSELGKFYFFGAGVPPDRMLAEQWSRDAAHRGATAGLHWLAQWWEDPKISQPPDPVKAAALYYEAGQLGHGPARSLLRERAKKGDLLAQKYVHLDLVAGTIEGSDPLPSKLREAVKWLEAHSSPGELVVQLALAEVMMVRELVSFDAKAATNKLAAAAAAGSDDARALQGKMMWHGVGQKTDREGAVALWRELAAKDNARALAALGALHWWGNAQQQHVEKDARKAFEYSKRAADRGSWIGQLNTADCYAHGIGTAVNYFLAAKYYSILEDRRFKRGREMKERILGYVKDE